MLQPRAANSAGDGLLVRPSLFARLTEAVTAGIVILSAPAGSGKTILLESWIRATGRAEQTAWATVDRGERDPQHFWLAVVGALRAIQGAAAAVDQRTATPEFDGDAFVDRLIGQLAGLASPVVLVIDDLHELGSADAQRQVERLLARRPDQLRVILATRHDLPLGLHRLRLAGAVTELRAADLRFSAAETSALLAASGVAISDAAAARLHARTEGWAAALRLAALSLAGHPDPDRFVAEFSGSERTIADYLVAEVLDRQPAEVRTLLLETSILDRVSGALADRLLGTAGSERILLELDAANAFVTAVDSSRRWFRYHQLFGDLLRLELRRTSPERVPGLHRAAAGWYAEHGQLVEAMRHRQAAEDWVGLAELLLGHGFGLVLDGHGPAVDRALAALPADALGEPELLALLAYRDVSERSLDVAAEHLALAERVTASAPADRRHRVNLALALSRLALARRQGDLDTALRQISPFLAPVEALTTADIALGGDARAVALLNLGIVELWSARLGDAQRHLEQALALARALPRPFVEIGCLSHLTLIASTTSLATARAHAEEAVRLADLHGWAADAVVGTALAGLASMDTAQGRFDEARPRLDRAASLLRAPTDAASALLVESVRGDLLVGERRPAEAIEAYRAAERHQAVLATRHILTGPVRDFIVLAQLQAGDAAAARATLAASIGDNPGAGEARLALAALQLADDDPGAAVRTLADVIDGAAPVLRLGVTIQALLVAAVAHDRLGDTQRSERLLERALDLAEPDGLMLPFVATPAGGLLALLERHPRHRTAHAALLTELIDVLRGSGPVSRAPRPGALAEELSASELRILRYLPSNLSASEIAAELVVSTSTVKTHMRHIYDKLDAHRRTEAVERARALGLLGPTGPRRS